MKKVLYILTTLAFIASLIGCTPAATPEPAAPAESAPAESAPAESTPVEEVAPAEVPTVVLNDWSWADDAWKECLTEVFDTFRANYGDKVNLEVVGNSYADTLNTLLVQAAAGNGPDLAMVKAEWIPQFMELDALADMKDVISDEAKADYGDSLDAYTIDGKLIALPFFGQGYAMFYNKDLLEKAGITELPKTFDELLEAANKVSALGKDDAGNTIYGLGLVNSGLEVAEGYNIFPWLWARGGDFLDKDGKIVLNSEANLKAFTEIQKLYADGVSPKGLSYKEMRNLFASGNLGFFWDLESQTASFAKASALGDKFIEHIGAFPIPGANEGEGVGYISDVVLIAFNTAKDMKAVGIVAEYLGSETTIQIMFNHGKGKMSNRASVMKNVFASVESPITQAYVAAMGTSRTLPGMNVAFADADEAITNAVTKLATGEDPAKVLADLDAEVKKLYGQ
jgi:multiple sugar transport system substrate-binding protein